MKKVVIITPKYFDFDKNRINIGGLETYVRDLAVLACSLGYSVSVYQITNTYGYCRKMIDSIEIISYPSNKKWFVSANQNAFEKIYNENNTIDTKFVIATDQMDIKSREDNVISIQHGIAFDIPGYMLSGFWGRTHLLQFVNKSLRCLKNVRRFYNTRHTVCVDYNYYNWFRTIGTVYPEMSMSVIPNYSKNIISKSELANKLNSKNKIKKIVFARRFVDYRGTLLFANVVKRILAERNDIDVTFAGNGPLEQKLKEMFMEERRVVFTKFEAADSVMFHKKFDIAVVPTIYSEGTSLSLCEAMAAGCIAIATHVGGMTNMILDGFNGILLPPNEDAIKEGLIRAIDKDDRSRVFMQKEAYRTIEKTFNFSRWQASWKKILG